jgi:hypothetical protein
VDRRRGPLIRRRLQGAISGLRGRAQTDYLSYTMPVDRDLEADALAATLSAATAAIEGGYFYLYIDGGAPIYRERVYCYELYHHMRRLGPANYPYSLNGEVDKRAHPILRKLDAEFHTPDFLVHTPGSMAGNSTIIEVKHALVQVNGIRKDISTLDLFVSTVGYRRAIYLIYGNEADDGLVERVARIVSELKVRSLIELWLHPKVGLPAIHTVTMPAGTNNDEPRR